MWFEGDKTIKLDLKVQNAPQSDENAAYVLCVLGTWRIWRFRYRLNSNFDQSI